MKKLVVLLLILGMTSWASAAIVSPIEIVDTNPTGGGPYTIHLPSGMSEAVDGSGGYFAIVGDAANPILGGNVILPPAPDASGLYGDSAGAGVGLPYGIYGFLGSYGVGWSSAAGDYVIDLTSTMPVGGFITLWSIADDFDPDKNAVLAEYQVIPEPMTVVLLGLGGLLMLRRRK